MFNLLLASVVLPLVAIALLWRRPARPRGGWIATLILALGMTAFSFFVASWAAIGMPLRYVIASLFLAAVVVSLRRPIDPERADDTPTRIMVKVLIGLFFGNVAIGALRARSVPPGARDIGFPLTRSDYAVIHGGSSMAANTYFGRGAQSFAVDVGKVTVGEPVVAPCDGQVLPTDKLRLQCGDMIVELSPVSTSAKGAVRRGTPIANATGPYLHVHAERNGQPVPVTFEGRWLVRNAIVRK
jgi:hypothetical protein